MHPLDVLAQAVPRLEHLGTMEADDAVCVNVTRLHVAREISLPGGRLAAVRARPLALSVLVDLRLDHMVQSCKKQERKGVSLLEYDANLRTWKKCLFFIFMYICKELGFNAEKMATWGKDRFMKALLKKYTTNQSLVATIKI